MVDVSLQSLSCCRDRRHLATLLFDESTRLCCSGHHQRTPEYGNRWWRTQSGDDQLQYMLCMIREPLRQHNGRRLCLCWCRNRGKTCWTFLFELVQYLLLLQLVLRLVLHLLLLQLVLFEGHWLQMNLEIDKLV